MTDFKALISLINDAIEKFNKQIPGIQQKVLDDLQSLVQKLDVKDASIKISTYNLKVLSQIKGRLEKIMLSPQYVNSVKDYVGNFSEIQQLQNDYFNSVAKKFSPPKLAGEIRQQAIESVAKSLTENGLHANITDVVSDMMRKAITGGASYSSLNKQLTDFLTNNETGDGQLLKYTKQITTDALNQFSGQYTQIISADLGFEWYRYSGSNIETTRPFCLACTDRKYFHISEIPRILRGDFPEFHKYDGKINPKTELPQGMIPGTDVTNFMTNRGGYNCGHQWRPVSEDLVPDDIKFTVYSTPEYKAWAIANGKQATDIPQPPEPTPKVPLIKSGNVIDLENHGDIKNIYDVRSVFDNNKQQTKDWFHNTEFKDLRITHHSGLNGATDMNGTIMLSPEKGRLLSEALNNIRNGVELTLDHEKAMATMWHELNHNMNKANRTDLTATETRYMELGNEFVSRKTLNQFFEKFGGKLSNQSLTENRNDTAYNTWVRNYDHLIEHFNADKKIVLGYMIDKMRHGNYDEVKTYLIEALQKGMEKPVPDKQVNKAVTDAIHLSESEFNDKY